MIRSHPASFLGQKEVCGNRMKVVNIFQLVSVSRGKMGKFPGRQVDLGRRKAPHSRLGRQASPDQVFGSLSLALLFAVAA